MGSETRLPHINFHIGAPRIAPDIIRVAAHLREVGASGHCRLLTTNEFQRHIRPVVNGSRSISGLNSKDLAENERFWDGLRQCEVLAASHHAMMGHPKVVFKADTILPKAEDRIERLSAIFQATSLDLHLTIMNQLYYLSRLPTDYLTREDTIGLNDHVPSWFDLLARIRRACPRRRILVWDFMKPENVALPFAMTILNVDESLADRMRKPVSEAITHTKVISKIFQKSFISESVSEVLHAQYHEDLHNIESMENVVLIRGEKVPADLHV